MNFSELDDCWMISGQSGRAVWIAKRPVFEI